MILEVYSEVSGPWDQAPWVVNQSFSPETTAFKHYKVRSGPLVGHPAVIAMLAKKIVFLEML
jgi:hypothetical protein